MEDTRTPPRFYLLTAVHYRSSRSESKSPTRRLPPTASSPTAGATHSLQLPRHSISLINSLTHPSTQPPTFNLRGTLVSVYHVPHSTIPSC